jgi:hypothetical protein
LGTFRTGCSENFAWEAISLAKLKYNFEIEVNFISIPMEEAEEIFQNFKQNNPKKASDNLKFLILPTDSGRKSWRFQRLTSTSRLPIFQEKKCRKY